MQLYNLLCKLSYKYFLLYRNTEQLNSTNVSKINFMQDIRIYIRR